MTSARRHVALAALAALILAAAALFGAAASSARAAGWGAKGYLDDRESILVVRPDGARDALWLVNPEDGSSVAAGTLPGRAGAVAAAPDGLTVAYLPASGAARVWLADGADGRTILLSSRGVRRVQGLAWIDARRLVVSGATRNTRNPLEYRLYVVDMATGTVKPFRRLAGLDPSAAVGAGKLAYVSITKVTGGSAPLARERLKLLTVAGTGAGRTIAKTQYRLLAGRRSFSRPALSPNALWLLTGKTGGDARVTYAVRDRSGLPLLTLFSPSPQAGAWDATGTRAAMGGSIPTAGATDACIWINDVGGGTLTRTPAGLIGDVSVAALAWAPTGTRLAAEAVGYDAAGLGRHLFVLPADLTWSRDLGDGGLPVWIVQ